MKLIGCLLLVSGWLIVLAALVMLADYIQRAAFIATGIGIEVLGLALVTRAYAVARRRPL